MCREDSACHCERAAYETLVQEGKGVFGSSVSGLVASCMVQATREQARGDSRRAMDWKLKIMGMLLQDIRRREDLEQKARRLQLEEESRQKPEGPTLAEYLEKSKLDAPQPTQLDDNGASGTNDHAGTDDATQSNVERSESQVGG